MLRLTAALPFVILMAVSAAAAEANVAGDWVAFVMGTKITINVDQQGSQIGGVAYVHQRGDRKDTYHFKGKIEHGTIRAAHHEGHSFQGKPTKEGDITGVLTTKGGHRFKIRAERR
jgi:hypothetical protein